MNAFCPYPVLYIVEIESIHTIYMYNLPASFFDNFAKKGDKVCHRTNISNSHFCELILWHIQNTITCNSFNTYGSDTFHSCQYTSNESVWTLDTETITNTFGMCHRTNTWFFKTILMNLYATCHCIDKFSKRWAKQALTIVIQGLHGLNFW